MPLPRSIVSLLARTRIDASAWREAAARRRAETAPESWRRFLRLFLVSFVGSLSLLAAGILILNPYNNLPNPFGFERVLLSSNQRFSYPAVLRSGEYDSIYVGTSTARLLPPETLNAGFNARFAAMAMNSATAWEQVQLVKLFLRETPDPNVVLFGLDHVWCDQNADQARVTERGFPEWLYDDSPWNDLLYMLNHKSIESAGRRIGYWTGVDFTPLFDESGYGVFTPAEDSYDAEKAHHNIWKGRAPDLTPVTPAAALTAAERSALEFPAHEWLDALMAEIPDTARVVAIITPVHAAAQPLPGSLEAAKEEVCKARLAKVAARHDAVFIDYRVHSDITRDDGNYWDALHYRMPIARQIADDVIAQSNAVSARGYASADDGR